MLKIILEKLIKNYITKFGKQPKGADYLKLKFLAQEEARQQEKIVPFPFKKLKEDAPFKEGPGWMEGVETEAEMAARMNRQNKEAVERIKQKSEKTKTAEEMMDKGDFDPSGMKDGGRIGYFSGSAVKGYQGIKSLMNLVNKKFGKETLKVADDVARPESAITRDLFKKMSDKLKNKLPEKAGQGKFTKAEAIIARLQNTINDIKPGDEDYEYVSKTFPNWIKELQAKPSLAENENVWKRLGVEGLPKNQRLKVYEDGTVDLETLKPTHTFKLKEEIKRKLNASGGLNYLMGL